MKVVYGNLICEWSSLL